MRAWIRMAVLAAVTQTAAASADIRVNDADNNSSLLPSGFTQSETALVKRGQTVCVAWNDKAVSGVAAGWGASSDGGVSFTDAGPFPVSNPQGGGTDPSVVYSVRDNAYYYTSIAPVFAAIHLWRSSDCSPLSGFQYSDKIFWRFAPGIVYGADREMIAIDNNDGSGDFPRSPFFGRAYVSFFQVPPAGTLLRIGVAWSDDVDMDSDLDGFPLTQLVTLPVPDPYDVVPQSAYVAIAPTGEVYIAIVEFSTEIGSDLSYRLYKSADGGVNWVRMTNRIGGGRRPENGEATQSCGYGYGALRENIRLLPSPQIAIQPLPGSTPPYVMHAVYAYDSDGTGPDESNVFYRRSTDGGENWSTEFKLNWDDPSPWDQWQPSLAVTEAGVVAATWYDRRVGWPP